MTSPFWSHGVTTVSRAGLAVPRGSVYGFLGPNGSGKTTTIRMLLGLVQPTSGSHQLLGMTMPASQNAVLPRVGSLVEGPAFYSHLSGKANLARYDAADRTADPRTAAARITEAMERVGGQAWTEEKYDGVRCQLHRSGTRVALYSRDLRETTAAFPEVAEAAERIDHDVLIDGEILAHRDGKVLRFFELQRRLGRKVGAKKLREEVPDVAGGGREEFALDRLLRHRAATVTSRHSAAPTSRAPSRCRRGARWAPPGASRRQSPGSTPT